MQQKKKKKKNLPKEKVTFLSCNLLIYKTVAVETRNPLLAYQFWSKQILIDNLEFCWTMQLHILLDQSHNQPYLLLWSSPSIIIIITSTYDIFPVVMYGYKSWTIKKTEHWRIDAFDLWCWKRLLRVPWTARRSNQSFLNISPEYSLEGLMLKLKLQYFGHLMRRVDSLVEHRLCFQ